MDFSCRVDRVKYTSKAESRRRLRIGARSEFNSQLISISLTYGPPGISSRDRCRRSETRRYRWARSPARSSAANSYWWRIWRGSRRSHRLPRDWRRPASDWRKDNAAPSLHPFITNCCTRFDDWRHDRWASDVDDSIDMSSYYVTIYVIIHAGSLCDFLQMKNQQKKYYIYMSIILTHCPHFIHTRLNFFLTESITFDNKWQGCSF